MFEPPRQWATVFCCSNGLYYEQNRVIIIISLVYMFPLLGYQSHWENISVYMCCELMTWSYAHLAQRVMMMMMMMMMMMNPQKSYWPVPLYSYVLKCIASGK